MGNKIRQHFLQQRICLFKAKAFILWVARGFVGFVLGGCVPQNKVLSGKGLQVL